MAENSKFLSRLSSFGLSEKESQVYLYLLKYGPKSVSQLAKSLKTYREDVHRTLISLVDKHMVNKSLESPTVYAAVELDVALDAALKKHETELREMEIQKQELEEIVAQEHFHPPDESPTFKIITSLRELIGLTVTELATAVQEWVIVCPAVYFVVFSLYTIEEAKTFIERGGRIRIITDFSYKYIEPVQQHLDAGVNVHQLTGYRGVTFSVFDKKISTSGINIDIDRTSLDVPVSVIWTDDYAYAARLMYTFEMLWKQAISAAPWIEKLLKEGAPT
jgi:sugar-specific transcriptional regulator TrmB